MIFKDEVNFQEPSLLDIKMNIVRFAIAEGGLINEFTHTVKGINPIYPTHSNEIRASAALFEKVDEIARYYKVNREDVSAEYLREDIAAKVLHYFYMRTIDEDIIWKKQKRYLYLTKDISFVEKPSEHIELNTGTYTLTYCFSKNHIKLLRLNDYLESDLYEDMFYEMHELIIYLNETIKY